MNLVFKRKLFLITLFITLFARSFTWQTNSVVPYTAIFIAFIGLWGLLMIFDGKFNYLSIKRPAGFIIWGLILYYIIWGLSNISALDYQDTIDVMFRSLLIMAFIIVCYYWINRLECIKKSVKVGYYAFTILMLFCFLVSINELDLKRTLLTFWESSESLRYRVLFTFDANNIAAEYAMTSIVLSIFMISEVKKNAKNRKLKIFIFVMLDLLMLFIILCNNSRGTLLAFLFVMFLVVFSRIDKRSTLRKLFKHLLVFVGVGVLVLLIYLSSQSMTFNDVLAKMNRSHFLHNIEALESGNRWLMGLGRISGKYFAERHELYGVKLDFMETFYVSTLVTSGIIGCIFIAIILIKMIKALLRHKRNNLSWWLLIVLGYMLFISIFEGYLFGSSYTTEIFFLIIILSTISEPKRKRQVVAQPSRVLVAASNE